MTLQPLFQDQTGRVCYTRIMRMWLTLGLFVLLVTILTPGCVHQRIDPTTYTGHPASVQHLHQQLQPSYFNPQTMTVRVELERPYSVRLIDRQFVVHTDGTTTQLDQAVRDIVLLIQQHIPPSEWAELDVGAFYDLPAR